MRVCFCLSVCLMLLMGGGRALADSENLSGGVFIAHAPPSLQYTNSPPSGGWCTEYSGSHAITSCEDQDNEIDSQGMVIWHVLCAWTESKTWCGTEFGLGDYDEEAFVVEEHGPCFPGAGLTIPTSGWPGPNEGIALTTTDAAWSGNFLPVYYVCGYAYAEDLMSLSADPSNGFGGWAGCGNQAEFAAADFGGMGLLTDGIYACPDGEMESGGDMAGGSIEGQSEETETGFDFPDSGSSSVCCLENECVFVTESECEELDGFFLCDMESCDGDPCGLDDTRTIREVYADSPGGIRQAIFLSADNDTILLHDGTYSGPNNRDLRLDYFGIYRDLVIRSFGDDPGDCTIDCYDQFQAAHWGIWVTGTPSSPGHTVIQGIKFENCISDNEEPCPRCESGAGVFVGQNPLGGPDSAEVINCVFKSCEAIQGGGGIFCHPESWFLARGCTFESNTAKVGGAVLSNSRLDNGYCEIEDCYFEGNTAEGGGAVVAYASAIGSGLDLLVAECVFMENTATEEGDVSLFLWKSVCVPQAVFTS